MWPTGKYSCTAINKFFKLRMKKHLYGFASVQRANSTSEVSELACHGAHKITWAADAHRPRRVLLATAGGVGRGGGTTARMSNRRVPSTTRVVNKHGHGSPAVCARWSDVEFSTNFTRRTWSVAAGNKLSLFIIILRMSRASHDELLIIGSAWKTSMLFQQLTQSTAPQKITRFYAGCWRCGCNRFPKDIISKEITLQFVWNKLNAADGNWQLYHCIWLS